VRLTLIASKPTDPVTFGFLPAGSALRVLEFARPWCAAHGVRNPELNLGGGMAVDYRRPHMRFDWASFWRGLASAARPGEILRVEPGRAVTAYCGWYVTRVLDVKRSHGKAFAVVAGGTHHLRTPAAKGHDQPFTVLPVGRWPHGWPPDRVIPRADAVSGGRGCQERHRASTSNTAEPTGTSAAEQVHDHEGLVALSRH